MNPLYQGYEKYLDEFEYRKRMCTSVSLERDISKELYGDTVMFNIYMGYKLEESLAKLMDVAEWYNHSVKRNGRNPQLEIDFAAMRLIRVLHYCDKNLTDEAREAVKSFFNKYNFESDYKSENHMLMFRLSRLLYAEKYPDEYLEYYEGKAGDFWEEDDRFLTDYFKFRAKRGWAEFDSFGYMTEIFNCLLTIRDCTRDENLAKLSEESMNVMFLDIFGDYMDGLYGGAHGRLYEGQVLSYKGAGVLSVVNYYFGNKYVNEPTARTFQLMSDYMPAPWVYEALDTMPETRENYESKHLHCISSTLPHRQVPQVDGSINKYTYATPDYVIGAVNFQDKYPEDSDAKWYAHHEQHEWDLTLPGLLDCRIFSHHPGHGGADEGKEHGRWTGDLGCGCGQFFCNKGVVIATYNIGDNQDHMINARVPHKYFREILDGNYIFLKRKNVFVSLYFSEGYRKGKDPAYIDFEMESIGSKHAVVCQVATDKEFADFDAFIADVKANPVKFDKDTMTVEYKNLKMNPTERFIDGEKVKFPYNTYDNPVVLEEFASGVIYVNGREVVDFNKF